MRVLVLAAANSARDAADAGYPLWLVEVGSQPLLEVVLTKVKPLRASGVAVALPGEDVSKYNAIDMARRVDPTVKVVPVSRPTKGATCTALLMLDHIDADSELLILNGNEFIDLDFAEMVDRFRESGWDAATLTFDSTHPRYSYVEVDGTGRVREAAEKRPISRDATMGFYWFARGADFVRAAMSQIRDEDMVGDQYYICPTLNYLILEDLAVGAIPGPLRSYHPLKTARQLGRL